MKLGRKIKKLKSKFLYFLRKNIHLKIYNFIILQLSKKKFLKSINSKKIVLAKVLVDKDSPYLKSIVLNKGSKNNVKLGMAIVDDIYLVGKIIEVNYTNSRALLLSDLNSKIPVLLEPAGIHAVLSGTGKNYGVIEFTKEEYNSFAKALQKVVKGYDDFLGRRCPYIMGLHAAPELDDKNFHFHMEFYPPLRHGDKPKVLAGSESMAGVFIMDVLPEETTIELRKYMS